MRKDPLPYIAITIGILCLLGLAIFGIVFFRATGRPNGTPSPTSSPSPVVIDGFSSCVAAGFPVMESYPRQCKTPSGQTFTEVLERAEFDDLIYVDSPLPGAVVQSPLVVSGAARGNWYFEASFPVRLLDANGRELIVIPAQAQGEWMTTEYVPFLVRLDFTAPETATGTLVLEKDNPSGLPEHAAQLRIPVRFR